MYFFFQNPTLWDLNFVKLQKYFDFGYTQKIYIFIKNVKKGISSLV